MRKIENPFVNLEGYICFGCSPDNHYGLQMEFFEDGESVVCFWEPKHHLQGYLNILHGGIQATLMDEIASWIIHVKLKTAGVTTKINSSLLKPVYTDKGQLTIKANILKVEKRLVTVSSQIFDAENELCAESEVQYYVYPEEIARKKLMFPGYEKFFKD